MAEERGSICVSKIEKFTVGDKYNPVDLLNNLKSNQIRSSLPDHGLSEMAAAIDNKVDWVINHIVYKDRLRRSNEPGFIFYFQSKHNPAVCEPMEVNYGPNTVDFVIRNFKEVYFERNSEFLLELLTKTQDPIKISSTED